jgi:hypothetical protein
MADHVILNDEGQQGKIQRKAVHDEPADGELRVDNDSSHDCHAPSWACRSPLPAEPAS